MNLRLERVTIRDWRLDDARAVQRHANNRGIWRNLRDYFPHPYTLEHAAAFLEQVTKEQQPMTYALATDEEAIGCMSVKRGVDVHRLSAEIGFWLAEPFWGRGIMSEAVAAFTRFQFEQTDLVRIYAEVFAGNSASARVLEKAGFTREGRLRASVLKDGVIQDALIYSVLRSDPQSAP